MIDIIGNIKIDETKPNRVRCLVACIRSFLFMRNFVSFRLNLVTPSQELLDIVEKEAKAFPDFRVSTYAGDYGVVYRHLLDLSNGQLDCVINFLEDHFMLLDYYADMINIAARMAQHDVQVLKASFHRVEINSGHTLPYREKYNQGGIFYNDEKAHAEYQRHYGNRYFIGVNFITSKKFAYLFWNRDCGPRPHEYEVVYPEKQWEHVCMIPDKEILCAIEDNHGEPGTRLLDRKEPKWISVYSQVCAEIPELTQLTNTAK